MVRMAGKTALIELLRHEGVEYVFGIPGATEIHFMDALERVPELKYILGLHEMVCAGMAEGYARASGKPGLLNLHTGTGTAAALPLLYNAYYGKVPLVVTVGQNDSRLLQRDPHLAGDIVGSTRPYTKWSTEIAHSADIPTVIQRAFKIATQPPTGPVLVSLPQDTLEDELDFTYAPNTVVHSRLAPDPVAVESALGILLEAKSPVLLVESGVARSDALAEVVRFAEITGCRVYQAWMSDVNFPVSHPQYLGDLDPSSAGAREVFAEADVLVGVGCSLFSDSFFSPEPAVPRGVRVIHVDEDPWEIGKNFPVDCGIHADIKTALTRLNEALDREMTDQVRAEAEQRVRAIGSEKASQEAGRVELFATEADNTPISISRLMKELREVVGPETVVVDECWSSSAALREIVAPARPQTFFRSRKGGSIGWGLPGALGVKLGLPDKDVVAVIGDGGASWSMQTLWTAARYRIPVTYVITNNGAYRQVKLVRRRLIGDYPLTERHQGMDLDDPAVDFSMLARAMGVRGERVVDPGDLVRALSAATQAREPSVIEVMVENRP